MVNLSKIENPQTNGLSAKRRNWIPIPLMTLPHQLPTVLSDKRYLTNFVGSFGTHPIRKQMAEVLKDRIDIKIIQNKKGEGLFVDTILQSYSTLCPRGTALGSYRFYETMQLGVVPIMISDVDFRPFPDKVDWNICSYYFDSVDKLPEFFKTTPYGELESKGVNAKYVWERLFEMWPEYVLEELKNADNTRR